MPSTGGGCAIFVLCVALVVGLERAFRVAVSNVFRAWVWDVASGYVAGACLVRPSSLEICVSRVLRARVVSNVRSRSRLAYCTDDLRGKDGYRFQVIPVDKDVQFYVGFRAIDPNLNHVFCRWEIYVSGRKDACTFLFRLASGFYRGVRVLLYVPSHVEHGLIEDVQCGYRLYEAGLRRRVIRFICKVAFCVRFDIRNDLRIRGVLVPCVSFIQA